MNGTRTDTYPGQYIKNNQQKQTHIRVLYYLTIKWPELHQTPIDWELTIQISKTGINRVNRLDATHKKQHAFRFKCLHKKIPTRTRLNDQQPSKHPTRLCPRCKTQEEDYNHLWTCIKTEDKFELLKNTTIQNVQHNYQIGYMWKNLNTSHDLDNSLALIERFGLTGHDFLTSPEAKGILTKETKDRFSQYQSRIPL
jgi:hypothetical protein